MYNIPFYPHLLPLIESGKKTQTLRVWKRGCTLKAGDQVMLGKKIPATVTYCYRKPLGELTPAEIAARSAIPSLLRAIPLPSDGCFSL